MDLLKKSMIETIKSYIPDIVNETLEIVLDNKLADGVIKDIPIISYLYTINKLRLDVRDFIFAKKILKFLESLSEISEKDRKDFINKYSDSEKLSENLLLIIDHLDSMEKPNLIANLLKNYINNKFDKKIFYRLCMAVEKTYIEDLKCLRENNNNIVSGLEGLGLANNGLAERFTFDGGSFGCDESEIDIYYRINKVGLLLKMYAFKSEA